MANNYDIILKFITDKSSIESAKKDVASVVASIEGSGKATNVESKMVASLSKVAVAAEKTAQTQIAADAKIAASANKVEEAKIKAATAAQVAAEKTAQVEITAAQRAATAIAKAESAKTSRTGRPIGELTNAAGEIVTPGQIDLNKIKINDFAKPTSEVVKYTEAIKEADSAIASMGTTLSELNRPAREIEEIWKENDKLIDAMNNANMSARAQHKLMGQVAVGAKTYAQAMEEVDAKVKKTAVSFAQLSRAGRLFAESINIVSNAMLVAGAATAGTLVKAAKDFIDSVETDTELTKEWKKQTASIADSYHEIGKVAASELMPYLKEAAELTKAVADYAQAHPEVVASAIRIGAILIAVGTIGKAVSQGIRLVADMAYVVATARAEAAGLTFAGAVASFGVKVKEFLAGVTAHNIGGVPPVGRVAEFGRTLGTVTLVATSVIIGAQLGLALGNKIADALYDATGKEPFSGVRETSFGDVALAPAMLIQGIIYRIQKALNELGLVSDESLQKVRNFYNTIDKFAAVVLGANKISAAMDKLAGSEGGVANATAALSDEMRNYQRSIVDATNNFRANEAQIIAQGNEKRLQIEQDYQAALQSAAQQNAAAIAQIASSSTSQILSITSTFESDMAAMEAQYYSDRAGIIADGQAQIQQIQQDSQERLRELALEHAKRVEELTNSRDALGLAQENRDYAEAVSEEKRRAKLEMQRAQQETQRQLAELDARYAAEKAQREQQYEEELAAANAASSEQYAQQAASYQAELKQLEEAKNKELSELDKSQKKELDENRRAYAEQLISLKNSLSANKAELDRYYAQAYEDVKAFVNSVLEEYSQLDPISETGVPGYASGGYAYPGLIRVEPGQREFVMNSATTRAMERVVGGKLTQHNILSSMGGIMQDITVQIGNGINLLQAKRILAENNRNFARNLENALRSI